MEGKRLVDLEIRFFRACVNASWAPRVGHGLPLHSPVASYIHPRYLPRGSSFEWTHLAAPPSVSISCGPTANFRISLGDHVEMNIE